MNYLLEGKPQAKLEIDIGNGTSLDLLQAVYRDVGQPLHRRLMAARAALPFEHPKLAVAVNVSGHDLAARMNAIRERMGGSNVIDAKSKAPTIDR